MQNLDQFFTTLAKLRKIVDSDESRIAVIAEKMKAKQQYDNLVSIFEQEFGFTLVKR